MRPRRCGKTFPGPNEVSNFPIPGMALAVLLLLGSRPWAGGLILRGCSASRGARVCLGVSLRSRWGLVLGASWLEVLLDLGIARGCDRYIAYMSYCLDN